MALGGDREGRGVVDARPAPETVRALPGRTLQPGFKALELDKETLPIPAFCLKPVEFS